MTPPPAAAALAAALYGLVPESQRIAPHLQQRLAASGWQVTPSQHWFVGVGPDCQRCGHPLVSPHHYALTREGEGAQGARRDASLRAALEAFFEDVDADWSNDNLRPGAFAFRFRAAADRLRAALASGEEGQ